jgi:hypothetical protein
MPEPGVEYKLPSTSGHPTGKPLGPVRVLRACFVVEEGVFVVVVSLMVGSAVAAACTSIVVMPFTVVRSTITILEPFCFVPVLDRVVAVIVSEIVVRYVNDLLQTVSLRCAGWEQ